MENDFLNSYQTAEWQRKKNAVLERDNYTCQICGNTSGLMQVHHITYKNCRGKAYNSPMGDLITLCEHCHANDDGDHKHFFDGKVTLSSGYIDKPNVSDMRMAAWSTLKRKSCWLFPIGVIVSMMGQNDGWRKIGFRTNEYDWFDYLLGAGDYADYLWVSDQHSPEWYPDQRIANEEEVKRLTERIGGNFEDFLIKWHEGGYKVDLDLYEKWFVSAPKGTRLFDLEYKLRGLEAKGVNGQEKIDLECKIRQEWEKQRVEQARELEIPNAQSEKPSEIILRSRKNPRIVVNVPVTPPRIMVNAPKSN